MLEMTLNGKPIIYVKKPYGYLVCYDGKWMILDILPITDQDMGIKIDRYLGF